MVKANDGAKFERKNNVQQLAELMRLFLAAASEAENEQLSKHKAMRAVTEMRARDLIRQAIVPGNPKQQIALAGLILSIADPTSNKYKFETAKVMLMEIYTGTQSHDSSFQNYLRKAAGII